MIKLFSLFTKSSSPTRFILPSLDDSLYPLDWQWPNREQVDINKATIGQLEIEPAVTFHSPQQLLHALVAEASTGLVDSIAQQQFCHHLYTNDVYQQWVNFTVFGRYIQRSFAAFYQQSEDSFNADMPEILRHELMRHAQYLPLEQTLFFAGKLSLKVRQDKLLMTTLNPFTALIEAQKMASSTQVPLIVNSVISKSAQVTAFAVRHHTRTRERLRSEVMILDFTDLRLVEEQELGQGSKPILLRHYQLR